MNIRMQVATPVTRHGLDNLIRVQLIRKYQRVEGNFDCCASAYVRVCQQVECLWRDECRKLVQD
jgi:hypothetical protein